LHQVRALLEGIPHAQESDGRITMLELKNLVFDVPVSEGAKETKRIIDDLSLTIGDDRFTVITGPNGGGKSTLAKLIMGIEKPTSGQIIFNGEDVTELSITERAQRGIGYGFQQPARFKGMKVKKLLELAAGRKLPMLACNEYLAKVGLCSAAYLTREVDKSLSGGEVKRIEIATILARDPKLAIYDEPEAGIDLWSFDRLTETFRDIHAARDGRSIVIISHQERIIQLADEVILINAGKIAETGTPEQLMPKLGFTAKGVPGCQLTEPTELHLTKIPTTC
jgi:Fe-S cluster assembly ATP-binding protein